MDGIYAALRRWATPRRAWITLAALLVNVVVLDFADRPLEALAGGAPKLDLRFGYTYDAAMSLLGAYGEAGRRLYLWNLAIDTTFPILLALTTVLFAALAVRRKWPALGLSIAPLEFMLTDLAENVVFVAMVARYPDLSPEAVAAASVLTQIKRIGFYISFVTLVASGLIVIGRGVVRWVRDGVTA